MLAAKNLSEAALYGYRWKISPKAEIKGRGPAIHSLFTEIIWRMRRRYIRNVPFKSTFEDGSRSLLFA